VPQIQASATAVIAAPAATVYDIIADYRTGHPRILPPQYFGALTVERGGRGAGTRIKFEMKAFGKINIAMADITEPVPGRELRETLASGIVTTFLVEPIDAGSSRVTIDTRYRSPGLRGWFESLIAPGFLRKVYAAELALLATEATRTHS
jgi:hypothetical protein